MTDAYTLVPVATVRGGRAAVRDDGWDAERAAIVLDASRFTVDAVAGLDAFSHLEVVYLFDRVDPGAVEAGARHPRGNTAGRGSGSSPSARRTARTASASRAASWSASTA